MTISAAKVMELRNITGAGMMDCKKALVETDGDMEQAQDFLRKKGISVAQKKSDRETKEGGVGIAISDDGTKGAIVHLACETDFVARNEKFGALLDLLTQQVLQKGGENFTDQPALDGSGTVGEVLTQNISTMGENLQLIDTALLEAQSGFVGGYVHSNKRIGVLVAFGGGSANEANQEMARDVAMHIAASQVHAVSADDIDPAVLEKEKEIFIAQAKESGKPDDIVEKMVQGRLSKFVKEVSLLDQPFVKDPDKTVRGFVESVDSTLKIEQFIKFQF